MKGVAFVDKFGCDYECRTVGESIMKYHITDDWYAEFDAYDNVYPIVSIQVAQIRESSNMMALKLREIKKRDEEYAGCIVLAEQKTIVFKVDYMSDLVSAMNMK